MDVDVVICHAHDIKLAAIGSDKRYGKLGQRSNDLIHRALVHLRSAF
jgi:hypothetical protein